MCLSQAPSAVVRTSPPTSGQGTAKHSGVTEGGGGGGGGWGGEGEENEQNIAETRAPIVLGAVVSEAKVKAAYCQEVDAPRHIERRVKRWWRRRKGGDIL